MQIIDIDHLDHIAHIDRRFCSFFHLLLQVVVDSESVLLLGLMQSIQNLGLVIVPMISGAIVDKYGYLLLELQFAAWVLVALFVTVLIWILDMVSI